MKIGVICDGSAEVEVLRRLLPKFNANGVLFCQVAYADMQPLGPVMQIVRSASTRIPILLAKGTERVVIVLDRETGNECPGDRAKSIREAFERSGHGNVDVVIKNRKLENWLIADAHSINTLNGFNIAKGVLQSIKNGGADSIHDAARVLSDSSRRGYSKRRDAIQIAQISNPASLEAGSRSFRRLLRVCGDSRYGEQSILPADLCQANRRRRS